MGKRKYFSAGSLVVILPVFVIVFFALLSIVNGFAGYKAFRSTFEEEYRSVSAQYAYTALTYVDGDKVLEYSSPATADDAWRLTDDQLSILTITASLERIQVIVPNKYFSTYTYVFDTIHPQLIGAEKHSLGSRNFFDETDQKNKESLELLMEEGSPYVRFDYNSEGGQVTTSLPVKNMQGQCVAILSVTKSMSELNGFQGRYRDLTLLTSFIVTLVVTILFLLLLIFYVVQPLSLITQETKAFAEHQGQLTGELSRISGKGELPTLARAVEKMSVDMQGYITDLTRTTAEKERIEAELDVAKEIQANMLPRIFPPYAEHPEIELYASMEPAKEVGGDFYDFFMIDNDHFAFVVGDVSGKGVPAALFMVIAKTLIKNMAMQSKSPSEVFTRVNNQLCEGNDAGLFVTCWLGIITLSSGKLTYCNAGHPKPCFSHEGKVSFLGNKVDLMLAAMDGTWYSDSTVDLVRGDRLFLYTDGVTEATNASNELYGEERLLSFVQKLHESDSKIIISKVREEINAFVGDAPQFDDITMLEFALKEV